MTHNRSSIESMASNNKYELQVGDKFARVSHGTVVLVDGNSIRVRNVQGFEWSVGRDIVEREFHIAGHVVKNVKVRPSDFEHIFKDSVGDNVFRVTFNKLPSVDSGVEAIDAIDWSTASVAAKKKAVKMTQTGEVRTLTGRLKINAFQSNDKMPEALGRMKVIDMDQEASGEPAERLVDLRTITELVVAGTRYHV